MPASKASSVSRRWQTLCTVKGVGEGVGFSFENMHRMQPELEAQAFCKRLQDFPSVSFDHVRSNHDDQHQRLHALLTGRIDKYRTKLERAESKKAVAKN